ncbi:alpha-protein kinase 3-like [Oenanthe melanoleuca]|uniref:alpha-protein kinase 3-like n=1 Tax=Oenanthe melanoleuca TaxID=2939378 RepID=UPI0024C15F41|nr:alpha-protein kinase 3-like [Oenanthe melanoleuca]
MRREEKHAAVFSRATFGKQLMSHTRLAPRTTRSFTGREKGRGSAAPPPAGQEAPARPVPSRGVTSPRVSGTYRCSPGTPRSGRRLPRSPHGRGHTPRAGGRAPGHRPAGRGRRHLGREGAAPQPRAAPRAALSGAGPTAIPAREWHLVGEGCSGHGTCLVGCFKETECFHSLRTIASLCSRLWLLSVLAQRPTRCNLQLFSWMRLMLLLPYVPVNKARFIALL